MSAQWLVDREERRRMPDRRARLHVCTPDETRGLSFDESAASVFQTTTARKRCEEALMEVTAASEYAHDSIERSIQSAKASLAELFKALDAAKAANRAGYLANGVLTEQAR